MRATKVTTVAGGARQKSRFKRRFAKKGYPLLASKPPVCCKEKKSRKKNETCCLFPGETCHQIQAQWDAVHMGNAIIRTVGGKKMLFDVVATS